MSAGEPLNDVELTVRLGSRTSDSLNAGARPAADAPCVPHAVRLRMSAVTPMPSRRLLDDEITLHDRRVEVAHELVLPRWRQGGDLELLDALGQRLAVVDGRSVELVEGHVVVDADV